MSACRRRGTGNITLLIDNMLVVQFFVVFADLYPLG